MPQSDDRATRARKQSEMQERTREFALTVVRTCRGSANGAEAWHIRSQLVRSATGLAANYRAACRSRSRKEFIARIGVVVEEADETSFWLDLASQLGLFTNEIETKLLSECNQLVAIFSATRTRALANLTTKK